VSVKQHVDVVHYDHGYNLVIGNTSGVSVKQHVDVVHYDHGYNLVIGDTSGVSVKQHVDAVHHVHGYDLVIGDTSGVSVNMRVMDVNVEQVEQTDYDAAMMAVPDTDMPYPVLRVKVKQ
jgi:hypothetical protein